MKEFTKNELPLNTYSLIIAGKVTYRGCGMGKYYNKTKIKIDKKEYMISNDLFNELGGIMKMKFNAPFRK